MCQLIFSVFIKYHTRFNECNLIENKLKVVYMFHIRTLRIVNGTVGRDYRVPEFHSITGSLQIGNIYM